MYRVSIFIFSISCIDSYFILQVLSSKDTSFKSIYSFISSLFIEPSLCKYSILTLILLGIFILLLSIFSVLFLISISLAVYVYSSSVFSSEFLFIVIYFVSIVIPLGTCKYISLLVPGNISDNFTG